MKTLQETVSHLESDQGTSTHESMVKSSSEQLPLLETLQRELANAQDTINALTNQNSQLKTQIIQGHGDTGDGDNNQVYSL